MLRIVPLEREHLDKLKPNEAAGFISVWLDDTVKDQLANSMAFSAIDDGEVLCCAGVAEYWPGRAGAWAMIAGDLGSRFIGVHRAVKQFLEDSGHCRIEAATAVGFCEGHRWLEMLGFKKETEVMKGYLPNGKDATMYVRGI